MARKPNYAFERNNRAKAKAAKREAKRQAKLAAKADEDGTSGEQSPADLATDVNGGQDSPADDLVPPERS